MCLIISAFVYVCVYAHLWSLPQIIGNRPNVCAKSHVAKRERCGETEGEVERGGVRGHGVQDTGSGER